MHIKQIITRKFSWDVKSIATLGFILFLTIMVILTAIGLSSMYANNQRLERVVNEQNTKLELIVAMRDIARERVISLFSARAYTDPFERDAALMKFRELASNFIGVRDQFQSMNLNQKEKTNLANLFQGMKAALDAQELIANTIANNQLSEAQNLLIGRAIPNQLAVFNSYDELFQLQKEISKKAIIDAEQANHSTYILMAFLVAVALGLGLIIAIVIIRRIAQVENALFVEKELAQVTLHAIAEGVITTNRTGEITYLNPVAESLTGWHTDQASQLQLGSVYNIIDGKTRESISYADLLMHIDREIVGDDVRLLIRRDGHEFAIQDSVAPIRNRDGKRIGSVLVFNDISEAHNLTQQLSWQARHDPLTGLANRREFEHKLLSSMNMHEDVKRQQVILFLDLDKFKLVNDTCGHLAGDELLKQLSRSVETKIRTSDTFARLGGDEFAILLDGCDLEKALMIAESIRQLIFEFKFVWEDKVCNIGVSIGIAALTGQFVNAADALAAADAACYKAKHEGRNQIQVYQAPT